MIALFNGDCSIRVTKYFTNVCTVSVIWPLQTYGPHLAPDKLTKVRGVADVDNLIFHYIHFTL